MNEDKVDLSPLDPATDAARWERRIRQVAARGAAGAARRRSGGIERQLSAWARPAMAFAAAAALAAWLPAWLRPSGVAPPAASETTTVADPAARLALWAASDTTSAAALLSALGDTDDSR